MTQRTCDDELSVKYDEDSIITTVHHCGLLPGHDGQHICRLAGCGHRWPVEVDDDQGAA